MVVSTESSAADEGEHCKLQNLEIPKLGRKTLSKFLETKAFFSEIIGKR